jgi:S1-C subfamily serine protease
MSQNPTGPNKLRTRLNQYLRRLKSALPFVYGVSSALLALLLFNFLFPKTEPMTVQEVKMQLQAWHRLPHRLHIRLKSSTSFSHPWSRPDNRQTSPASRWSGSGVVIDMTGRILTSLHVVADASEIEITYERLALSGRDGFIPAGKDVAVLTPLAPPPQVFPAILGNPDSMPWAMMRSWSVTL